MATTTPHYNLILPSVNDPTDQDLWGGMLNSNFMEIDSLIHDLAQKEYYPVGSLYFNATVNTNPATLLGFGTWVPFAQGRVIIGVGTGTDANSVVRTFDEGDEGGEYQHTQTEDELAPHTHTVTKAGFDSTLGSYIDQAAQGTKVLAGDAINESGGGDPFNVMNPYIAVHIWVRTA